MVETTPELTVDEIVAYLKRRSPKASRAAFDFLDKEEAAIADGDDKQAERCRQCYIISNARANLYSEMAHHIERGRFPK